MAPPRGALCRLLRLVMATCVAALCVGDAAPASAQTIWERIARPTDGEQDELAAGWALEQAGDIEGALDVYRNLGLGSDTESAFLYELRALLARPAETVALTNDVLSEEPGVFRSQQLFFRALALIELRELDDAITTLRAATRYQTDLPHAHLYLSNLAECYAAQDNPAMAAVYFQQALNRAPTYQPARLGLAAAALRSGDMSGFLHQVERAGNVNTTLEELRTRVPYTIVDGERALYEAIFFLSQGDPASAQRALAEHRESDAARLTPAAYLDAVAERIGEPWFTVSSFEFDTCMIGWASAVRNGRIAVWCHDGTLSLNSIENGVSTMLDSWFVGYNMEGFALRDDGTIVSIEWGQPEVQRFAQDAGEPTRQPFADGLSSDGTRFFSADGRVLWNHVAHDQSAHAWTIDSSDAPTTVSLSAVIWGYNYASSPRGERFVMSSDTDHVIVSQDGSVQLIPHSNANPYATPLLVNDEGGLHVSVRDQELHWRDESLALLQRWRNPNGTVSVSGGTALMGDQDVVVTWAANTVWLLGGRPVPSDG